MIFALLNNTRKTYLNHNDKMSNNSRLHLVSVFNYAYIYFIIFSILPSQRRTVKKYQSVNIMQCFRIIQYIIRCMYGNNFQAEIACIMRLRKAHYFCLIVLVRNLYSLQKLYKCRQTLLIFHAPYGISVSFIQYIFPKNRILKVMESLNDNKISAGI